jgi:hypothetical protein
MRSRTISELSIKIEYQKKRSEMKPKNPTRISRVEVLLMTPAQMKKKAKRATLDELIKAIEYTEASFNEFEEDKSERSKHKYTKEHNRFEAVLEVLKQELKNRSGN